MDNDITFRTDAVRNTDRTMWEHSIWGAESGNWDQLPVRTDIVVKSERISRQEGVR